MINAILAVVVHATYSVRMIGANRATRFRLCREAEAVLTRLAK